MLKKVKKKWICLPRNAFHRIRMTALYGIHFVLLSLLMINYSNADDWIDQAPYLKERILSSHNQSYPQFVAWATTITKRIERIINDKRDPRYPKNLKGIYVYHVDGEMSPASVVNRRGESEYAVFIDTIFLKDIFQKMNDSNLSRDDREEELARGLRLIEGSIAHEMGHVFNEDKKYTSIGKFRDQIEEIDADLSAIQLLRSAGLHRQAEIEAQEFLSSQYSHGKRSLFSAATSTHPSGDFRESAVRLNTTWDTFTSGAVSVVESPYTPDLITELRHFPADSSTIHPIGELLARVEEGQSREREIEEKVSQKIKTMRYPGEIQTLGENAEFVSQLCTLVNHKRNIDELFISLVEAEKTGDLHPGHQEHFLAFIGNHFRRKHKHPYLSPRRIEDLAFLCLKEKMVPKVKNEPLRLAIYSSSFLQSPRYSELIQESAYLDLPQEDQDLFVDTRKYSPPQALARVIARSLDPTSLQTISKWKDSHPNREVGEKLLDLHLMIELGKKIRENPEDALQQMEDLRNESPLFQAIKFRDRKDDQDAWEMLNDQERASLRDLAGWIWENRSRIGLLGFHWAEIWRTLGIPQDRGRLELKNSVLANARGTPPSSLSRSFFEWVNFPKDSWFGPNIEKPYLPNESSKIGNSPDVWGGVELFEALRDLAPDTDLKDQEEGMTDAFHRSLAQKVLKDLKTQKVAPSEFGSFAHERYEEVLNQQDISGQKYKLPFLIGSRKKPKAPKFNRFMNLHEEYPFWRNLLMEIDQDSELSPQQKQEALLSLVRHSTGRQSRESDRPDHPAFSGDLVIAVPLFLKYGVFKNGDELFKWASEYGAGRFKDLDDEDLCENREGLFSFIDSYLAPRAQELAEEMKTQNPQIVMAKAREYLNARTPARGKSIGSRGEGREGMRGVRLSELPQVVACMNSPYSLRNFKTLLVNGLLEHRENSQEIMRNFDLLTLTGSNEATDRYLRSRLPQLKADSALLPLIRKIRLERQIQDDALKAEVLEYLIDQEPSKGESRNRLDETLARITQYLSVPSSARDQLLERVAWKDPKIGLDDLKEKVQPLKLRSIDGTSRPMVINLISLLGTVLGRAPLEQRLDWIRYLKDPNPQNKAKVFEHLRTLNLSDNLSDHTKKITPEQLMDHIDSMIHQSPPVARVPLLDFILGQRLENGSRLYQTPELRAELGRLSGFIPGSQEERILQAYLESCPDYERSPIISYFLMHQKAGGKGGIDLRPLFEVFSTLGIKTAQLAAIFNQVDPESKEELSLLKDQAKNLEKAEVLEILKKTMGPDFDRVKVNRILGSASIKTVVEVEWEDGRRSAVMIRRPNAKPLVQEHLNRSARFIENLKKDPVLMQDPRFAQKLIAFQTLGEIVKAELAEEVEFEKELENTAKAGQVHGTSQKPKKIEPSGWMIQVPQVDPTYPGVRRVSTDDDAAPVVMFMEMAKGRSVDQIQDPAVRSQVGRAIVQELVTQLFTQGFMNADPHKGNFLIDPETQTIHPIDFGQAERLRRPHLFYSRDEVEILAHFFAAFSCQDIPRLVGYGSQFCDPEPRDETKRVIEARLRELARSGRLELIEVINAFHDLDAKFSKRSFGILKGIAVLQNEGYVSEDEFREILSQAIRDILTGTWSAMAQHGFDRLSQRKDQLIDLLEQVMRVGRPQPGSCPR